MEQHARLHNLLLGCISGFCPWENQHTTLLLQYLASESIPHNCRDNMLRKGWSRAKSHRVAVEVSVVKGPNRTDRSRNFILFCADEYADS